MLLRTARPSPPFDLSMSATCTEGIPADAQTMCWSTVVAAALSAPEASAAERCTGAMKRISMSTPFFLKIPASSASLSGWKPVHPLMPRITLSCAAAEKASSIAAINPVSLMRPPFALPAAVTNCRFGLLYRPVHASDARRPRRKPAAPRLPQRRLPAFRRTGAFPGRSWCRPGPRDRRSGAPPGVDRPAGDHRRGIPAPQLAGELLGGRGLGRVAHLLGQLPPQPREPGTGGSAAHARRGCRALLS